MVQDSTQGLDVLQTQRSARRRGGVTNDDIAASVEDVGLETDASRAHGGEERNVAIIVVVAVALNRLDAVERVEWPGLQWCTGSLVGGLGIQDAASVQLVKSVLLGRSLVAKSMVRDAIVANLPRSALGVVIVGARALSAVCAERKEILLAVCSRNLVI